MSELSYGDFMKAMMNAPIKNFNCNKCGGLGIKPVMCCSGGREECGCMGMPTDFIDCECGATQPTDEEIKAWSLL